MGCSNSHLRPLFRRCRGKGRKKEDGNGGSSSSTNGKGELIEDNHIQSTELIQGFNFLGSSIRSPSGKPASSSQSVDDAIVSDPNPPFCVPLLAQS